MPQLPQLSPIADQPISVALLACIGSVDIEGVVTSWIGFLDQLGREYELIVADGNGGDALTGLLPSLSTRYPRLRVVKAPRPGEGAALGEAVALARFPLFFYTMCDPVYRPADLGKMLERRSPTPDNPPEIDQVQVVSGFRAGCPLPGGVRILGWCWRLFCRVVFSFSPTPLPGWLGWRGQLGRLVARVFFGLRNRDVLCPFRLFRRDIFQRIPIQSAGRFAHIEVLAKANFLGCVMAEDLPIDVRAEPDPHWREMWREGWRVLNHPDFGPAVIEAQEEPADRPSGEEPVLPSDPA